MKTKKTALITGGSRGLGYELAERLAQQKWNLLITAREAEVLMEARKRLSKYAKVEAIAGDVRDEIHLMELPDILTANDWKLDLVVNNASALGLSPLEKLLDHSVDNLHVVFHTNLIAPISLLQKTKGYLNKDATVVNVSSDAAVEAYERWGAYSGSKAGLDHMTKILAKENPEFYFYSFDPGDMKTEMHQAAFPNEDISDRPLPSTHAVPAILQLIGSKFPSGRYNWESLKSKSL